MTVDADVPALGATPARPEERTGARWRRLVAILLGPLWVTTFRDPVREGHLRLDALSRAERQLARTGLVMLVLLLGSVLVADLWRSGELLQLKGQDEIRFLPTGVLPVTLLGFLLAWSLVAWGALAAAPSVRVVVACLMVVTSAQFDLLGVVSGLDTWALEHGGTLMRVGYVAAPATLVLSAALHPLVRRRPRLSRWVTALLRVAVLAALALLYGVMLWLHVDFVRHGYDSPIPTGVDASIEQIGAFLLPLVYVSSIAVIDFALDVSESLATPARRLAARWARLVLLALLAYKVLTDIVLELDVWRAELTYQPVAFARTLVSVALLAVLVALVTRFPHSETYQLAKERAIYGGSFLLASAYLLSVVGAGIALLVAGRFDSDKGAEANDAVPYDVLGTEGYLMLAALAAVAGIWLMRRSEGGYGDELGSALVVVGIWNATTMALPTFHLELGFTYPLVDALVVLGVLALLLVRWRAVDTRTSVTLITVVLFSWLVMSRGDYISFLGGLLGLPGILVIIVGVALTLASGAAFAHVQSRRLPSNARPLLFVGYLLLSVVILHWVEVTHEAGQDADALAAFYFLGLPMAAWLLGRRVLDRGERAGEDQAATVLR